MADYVAPTWQRELDHTDQESISPAWQIQIMNCSGYRSYRSYRSSVRGVKSMISRYIETLFDSIRNPTQTHAPIFQRVLSDDVVKRASRSCPNSPTPTVTRTRFPGWKPLSFITVGLFAFTSWNQVTGKVTQNIN